MWSALRRAITTRLAQSALSISWNSFPTAARSPSSRAAPATLSGELRRDGCKETLEADGSGKYQVVDVQPADWDRQKALDVATNIITKTPDLNAFFVANDTMALGVMQAIANTGNTGKDPSGRHRRFR